MGTVEIPELPNLITISLAASIMGVSRQGAHKMVQSGKLRAWRIRSDGNDRPYVVLESEARAIKPDHAVVSALPV
jgi:hypothetical protein